MKRKIRLVVADIDGTLETLHQPLPEINREAMEALHREGILYGLASGRSVRQLEDKVREWGLSFDPELLIGVNGQSIYDGILGKKEDLLLFRKEWVEEIIDFLDACDYDYHVYIDSYTLFKKKSDHFYKLFSQVDRDVRLASCREDFLQGDFFKFLLIQDRQEKVDELLEKIQPLMERHRDHFKILRTTPVSYEIVHADASKGYALKMFCQSHGIALEDVAAFGDADNDNDMIEISGMGVCLRDGVEVTRKVAAYLTDKDCSEGGFGDFVFRKIL